MKRWFVSSYFVVLSACGADLAGLGVAEEEETQPVLPELEGEQPTRALDAGALPQDASGRGPDDASAASEPAQVDAAQLDSGSPPSGALDGGLPPVISPPVISPPVLPPPPVPPGPLTLSSPAFGAGDRLPGPFTCVGGDASPPLVWTPGPPGTQSYAIVLSSPSEGWGPWPSVQWVVWDIPGSLAALPQGVKSGAEPANVPGARQAGSSAIPLLFPSKRYQGPCGLGRPQVYNFTVYALGIASLPPISPLAEPDSVAAVIVNSGRVLAVSTLSSHFP